MFYNLEPSERPSESEDRERILNILERAYELKVKAELTVLEPSGQLRTAEVFIEACEDGQLYVSASKESPVMTILLESVKDARLTDLKE